MSACKSCYGTGRTKLLGGVCKDCRGTGEFNNTATIKYIIQGVVAFVVLIVILGSILH